MSTKSDNVSTEAVESGSGTGESERIDRSERTESTESTASELPLDVVFEIIRNERRRLVLQYLEDNDGDTTLSDLAEHIAAIENDTTVAALSAQQRKRVYVGLYQCHLPKMADSGIVEFNKDRGLVRPGPNIDQLEPYLEVDPEADDTDRGYLVLGGVAVVGYALAAFGGFAGMIAGGVVVLTTLAMFGIAAARRHLNESTQ